MDEKLRNIIMWVHITGNEKANNGSIILGKDASKVQYNDQCLCLLHILSSHALFSGEHAQTSYVTGGFTYRE